MKIRKQGDRNLFTLISEVARNSDLSSEVVVSLLEQTFRSAFLKEYPDNVIDVVVDLKEGKIEIWRNLKVVTDDFFKNEGFEDEETLIPISRVSFLPRTSRNPSKPKVGDIVYKEVNIEDFDAQLISNIQFFFKKLTQNEIGRSICQKWMPFQGRVMEGVVEEIIENKEDRSVRKIIVSVMASDGSTAKGVIYKNDLIWVDSPGGGRVYENLVLGHVYLFYIKEVSELNTRIPISLSRTDAEIVKYLMAKHISEIENGLVEIKGIARLAGIKTKVLVHSNNPNIDPVGCCIGPKGKRLRVISGELLNEKIDVILWNEDPIQNIINSFVTGKIIGYKLDGKDDQQEEDGKPKGTQTEENSITLVATLDNLLSCMGKRGSNIRLVYMLTNWKINLKTIQEAKDENLDYISIDDDKFISSNKISERIYKMHFKKREDILEDYYAGKRNLDDDPSEL